MFRKGSGSAAGTTVIDLAGTDPGRVVDRAALLRELLAPLPSERMSTSFLLVGITASDAATRGGIELQFQDGSIKHADALIGEDNISVLISAPQPIGVLRTQIGVLRNPISTSRYSIYLGQSDAETSSLNRPSVTINRP